MHRACRRAPFGRRARAFDISWSLRFRRQRTHHPVLKGSGGGCTLATGPQPGRGRGRTAAPPRGDVSVSLARPPVHAMASESRGFKRLPAAPRRRLQLPLIAPAQTELRYRGAFPRASCLSMISIITGGHFGTGAGRWLSGGGTPGGCPAKVVGFWLCQSSADSPDTSNPHFTSTDCFQLDILRRRA